MNPMPKNGELWLNLLAGLQEYTYQIGLQWSFEENFLAKSKDKFKINAIKIMTIELNKKKQGNVGKIYWLLFVKMEGSI